MACIYTLEQIREKLKDRKVSVVCERLNLSRQAVYNILNGANVSFETYQKLVEYLFPEELWASAALSYKTISIYNGWFSSKEEAEACVRLMNKRLPHIKWELVKKSDRSDWIFWKDFDMELYDEFLGGEK